MALPIAIEDTDTVRLPQFSYYVGPYKSAGSNVYMPLSQRLGGTFSHVRMYKATDPASGFTGQDTGNEPVVTSAGSNFLHAFWAFRVSDVIHMSFWNVDDERYDYVTFNMADDTWGTPEVIEAPADRPVVDSSLSCSLAVRTNGDIVVFYQGDMDKEMGQDYHRTDYAIKTGAGWTVGVSVDNSSAGGAEDDKHYHGNITVMGTPGTGGKERMHFFLLVGSGDNDAVSRTLFWNGSAETLESWAVGDASSSNDNSAPGINVGGAIKCPYKDANNKISFAEFTSADSPGAFTINADVSANEAASDISLIACLVADGNDVYLLYSGGGTDGADRDLYLKKNDDAETEEIDGDTINRISFNIYERSSRLVLAYVYMTATEVKYDEIVLTPAPPEMGGKIPRMNRVMIPAGGL